MISPYKGKFKISQIYKGANHKGLDLVGLSDKTLLSVVNGKVVTTAKDPYFDGGMGYYVKLRDNKTGYYVLYAHTSKFLCKTGDTVTIGQPVAVEGDTGHSFGSHCHLEVRTNLKSNSFIDVSKFIGIPNAEGMYNMPQTIDDKIRQKFGFSDETMKYLAQYEYADDLFEKMLMPAKLQNYQLSTINYILSYKYGADIFKKLGVE